jgi:hypothetical protein
MVLDIAELDFIGAAGLLVVSNAEKRLAELGAELTVRSTSDLVNRLLDLMEQAEVSDSNEHFPSTAISDQRNLGACLMFRGSLVVVARARFRRATAMPADPDVVDGVLRLVVDLAVLRERGRRGECVHSSAPSWGDAPRAWAGPSLMRVDTLSRWKYPSLGGSCVLRNSKFPREEGLFRVFQAVFTSTS